MKGNKFKILLPAIALLALVSGAKAASHPEGWEANLTVGVTTVESRLSFGQRASATDGIDGGYDVPAMLGGDIKAYFFQGGGNYWRDIKAMTHGEAKMWRVRVESGLNGKPVVLRWNPNNLPIGDVTLTDNIAGAVIDMRASGSYSYDNDGMREFSIEVAPAR